MFWFRRLRRRIVLATLLAVVILLALIPSILSNSRFGPALVAWLGSNDTSRVSVERLSCGWLSPVVLSGLRVEQHDEAARLTIDRVAFSRTWWRLWLSGPELGAITVDSPRIELVLEELQLPDEAEQPPFGESTPWEFEASVHDLSVVIATPDNDRPSVSLSDLDVHLRVEDEGTGRMLTVEPFQAMADRQLTSELYHQGLQLIAPVLADNVIVEGRATLTVDECVVPLDNRPSGDPADATRISGTLRLDDVTAELNNPLIREISTTVSQLFRFEMPSTLQVADESTVRFQWRQGRVYHEGLVFLLPELSPDLVFETRGEVGLDDSIDLIVEAQLPWTLLGDAPLFQRLAERPLAWRVTGTLDEPQVRWEAGRQWLSDLGRMLDPENDPLGRRDGSAEGSAGEAVVDSILSAVGALLSESPSDESAQDSGEEQQQGEDAFPVDEALDALRGVLERRRESGDRDAPGLLERLREQRRQRREVERTEEDRASSSSDESGRRGLFRRSPRRSTPDR